MEGEEEELPEQLQVANIQRELEDRRRLYEENGVQVAEYIENTRPAQEWFTIRPPKRISFFGAIMGLTLFIFLILVAVGIHAIITSWSAAEEQPDNWWLYLFNQSKILYYFFHY